VKTTLIRQLIFILELLVLSGKKSLFCHFIMSVENIDQLSAPGQELPYLHSVSAPCCLFVGFDSPVKSFPVA
jgi:hypothetical protein